MEPLPDGWKRPRYDFDTARRIVAYWRYDAPHPRCNDDPSKVILRLVDSDLEPLWKYETVPVLVQQKRPPSNWVHGWKDQPYGNRERPSMNHRPPPILEDRSIRVLLYDDLLTLCPGIFGAPIREDHATQKKRKRTGTTREDELGKAIKAARQILLKRLKREPSGNEVYCHLYSDPEKTMLKTVAEKTIANRLSKIREET